MKSIYREIYPEIFSFLEENKLSVRYVAYRRSFVILSHDGEYGQEISYCPWTGKKLPDSLADKFGELLESKGLSAFEPETWPDSWRSEEWWISANL